MEISDKLTIQDIAKLVGVSKTTVSFAFNRPNRVSKKTLEKIMKVCDEVGFSPDPGARSLVTKRKNAIGLLLPEITPEGFKNPYLFQVLQGMRLACVESEQSLKIISPTSGKILEAVRSAIVDGIVIHGIVKESNVLEYLEKSKIPVISLDGGIFNSFPIVSSNDFTGGESIMNYILSKGHRNIVILTFKDADDFRDNVSLSAGNRRLKGYSSALQKYGLSLDSNEVEIVCCDECSLEGGYSAIKKLLANRKMPDAVVAMSDILAIGVYTYCKENAIDIPNDLSIVGYDDIFDSHLIQPGLTTVKQQAADKGEKACRELLSMIKGEKYNQNITFDTELIIRDSVKSINVSS